MKEKISYGARLFRWKKAKTHKRNEDERAATDGKYKPMLAELKTNYDDAIAKLNAAQKSLLAEVEETRETDHRQTTPHIVSYSFSSTV